MAKTCYMAKNEGPMSSPMSFALVTNGNETRLHSIWTPKKILQVFVMLVAAFGAYVVYAEARFRYAPSAEYSSSAFDAFTSAVRREMAR